MIRKLVRRLKRERALRSNVKVTRRILDSEMVSKEDNKSILFFTTHKCASSFVNILFHSLSENSAFSAIDYMKFIWRLGDRTNISHPYIHLEKRYSYFFRQYGEIYAPLRAPIKFPRMESYKVIFFLRDPRDVLVSSYHSFGRTHSVPYNSERRNEFNEKRDRINNMTIDQYCIEEATLWLKPIYIEYKKIHGNFNDSLFLNYDFFKENTAQFIREIVDFSNLEVAESKIEELARLASPVQSDIKPNEHKRSGKSQQFLKGLSSETVTQLNLIFKEELEYWNF